MTTAVAVSKKTLYVIGLPVVLIALWWACTANSSSYYFPSLGKIAETFGSTWLTTDRLTNDVLPSMARLAAGYALCVALGTGLGMFLGLHRRARATAEPVLEFFRAIPPPVLIPVLMIVAGIGDGMKVLVIVLGAVWPVLLNTVEGVRAVDEVLSDTSRSYGITGIARIRYLVLPGASPQIIAGMRQALSISIILMVISEMFASSSGLGFTVVQFQRGFAIPQMWSGIIVLGLLGFLLSLAFGVFERRALGWYHGLLQSQPGEK
ncbi:ABC transporter permease [Nocardia sp. NBC_01329]|uniref:ABC transporter permease n=1 Tax=Nocardia sp. NBC_01329 TaxID=2903594 RepID=UPI002E160BE9|nr:ABC transporter permease [Nocardia sp. NBC_01329]